jgi:hypothetical protein
MKYLELFPRESKNSRSGSDVPRDGESKETKSFTNPRSKLEIYLVDLRERKKGGATVRKESLGFRRPYGVFIPTRTLSVVPALGRYYRGPR